MTVESATYLNTLNPLLPAALDDVSEGDDHLRLVKTVLQATFPAVAGAVTPTHTELNYVDGVTSAIQTQLDGKTTLGLIPQNSKSAAYTTVLGDSGKHIFHPSTDASARIFTIDSNANVAYPIGTAITFVNQFGAGVVTISITSDTMRLAGPGTTGSRTLAAGAEATALKIGTTDWIISGTPGLT